MPFESPRKTKRQRVQKNRRDALGVTAVVSRARAGKRLARRFRMNRLHKVERTFLAASGLAVRCSQFQYEEIDDENGTRLDVEFGGIGRGVLLAWIDEQHACRSTGPLM